MASPAMAGATVLLRQYLVDGWYPTGAAVPANSIPNPSAAMLKAMAINSADSDISGYTAPDNNVGWGRINDDNVCYFAGDTRRLALVDNAAGLLTGEYVEYQVYVADNTIPPQGQSGLDRLPRNARRGRGAGQRPQPDRDGRYRIVQGERLPAGQSTTEGPPTAATWKSACGGTPPP